MLRAKTEVSHNAFEIHYCPQAGRGTPVGQSWQTVSTELTGPVCVVIAHLLLIVVAAW